MPNIVIAENGKIRSLDDVEFAEDIVKKRNQKDPWTVIDTLVRTWAKRSPDEVEAVMVNVSQYRETLTDKQFGQTTLGKDQERRFTLAFPRTLMLMIRTMYKAEELPFDKKFFAAFAKKYPAFRVAEKG